MNQLKIISMMMFVILVSGCEKAIEPPPPPRPALVTIVEESTESNDMVLVGEVKSRYESNLSFRLGGKITARLVEVGSAVQKDQPIARLDASDVVLNTQAANADVKAAEANYALAKAEVDRQRSLFSKKFISQSALDLREAELKTSAARVTQAKAQAAVASNQTQYTTLVADRAGIVTLIRAEPGQVVQAGERIAQLIDPNAIEVQVAVPELRMAQITADQKVEVKLWVEQENTYLGKVREIAPAANSATRTFDVRVAFVQADEKVKFGMTAGVRFGDIEQVKVIVPNTALTQVRGETSVWVIDKNGIAQPRKVNIGQYSENGVEIISGLHTGEMVAIAGVHTLIQGQKVRPQIEALL